MTPTEAILRAVPRGPAMTGPVYLVPLNIPRSPLLGASIPAWSVYSDCSPNVEDWIPSTAPVRGECFLGMDRSVDYRRLSGQRLQASGGALQEAVIMATQCVMREGGEPDLILVGQRLPRLERSEALANSTIAEGVDCSPGEAWVIDTRAWRNYDGKLVCVTPAWNCRIMGLTDWETAPLLREDVDDAFEVRLYPITDGTWSGRHDVRPTLARAIFDERLEPEAKVIAESGPAKRVLDVMWDRTKPKERREAEEYAERLKRRM